MRPSGRDDRHGFVGMRVGRLDRRKISGSAALGSHSTPSDQRDVTKEWGQRNKTLSPGLDSFVPIPLSLPAELETLKMKDLPQIQKGHRFRVRKRIIYGHSKSSYHHSGDQDQGSAFVPLYYTFHSSCCAARNPPTQVSHKKHKKRKKRTPLFCAFLCFLWPFPPRIGFGCGCAALSTPGESGIHRSRARGRVRPPTLRSAD